MADSQQVHGRTDQPVQQGAKESGNAPHVEPDHAGHGQSPAAWTAVFTCMAGTLIMCIAVVIASVWLFIVGAVVFAGGGVAGKVLSAMGFGASGRPGH